MLRKTFFTTITFLLTLLFQFNLEAQVIKVSKSFIKDPDLAPGRINNKLLVLFLNVEEADSKLNSFSFTTKGNYNLSDLSPGAPFKLYYSTFSKDSLIARATAVLPGGKIKFSGLNFLLEKKNFYSTKFILTVDVSNDATDGHTIGFNEILPNDFSVSAGTVETLNIESETKPIITPKVKITPFLLTPSTVSAGTEDATLYKFKMVVSDNDLYLDSLISYTKGTYSIQDLEPYREITLNYSSDEELSYDYFAGVGRASSGNKMVFKSNGYILRKGETYIFSITADINSPATIGKNIGIKSIPINNFHFGSKVISSGESLPEGQLLTFGNAKITLTYGGPQAGNTSPGSEVLLYKCKIDVSGASAALDILSFSIDGTVKDLDLDYLPYSLYLSKTGELSDLNNIKIDDTFHPTFSSEINFFPSPNNIPIGTSYLLITATIGDKAIIGNTIGTNTFSEENFDFNESQVEAVFPLPKGGLQTIIKPLVSVSHIPVPNGKIGSESSGILYKLKIQAYNTDVWLDSLTINTAGTFTSDDISSFYLYANDSDSNIGMKEVAYSTLWSYEPGKKVVFSPYSNIHIPKGTAKYLYVVADLGMFNDIGNTIQITEINAKDIVFLSGETEGSFPLPKGGIQTISKLNVNVTPQSIDGKNLMLGSKNNIIYKFTANTGDTQAALNWTYFYLGGNFKKEDIQEFGLWVNNENKLEGAFQLETESLNSSDTSIEFNEDFILPTNSPVYFFVTADISNSAVNGNYLNVKPNQNNIGFSLASQKISMPAGGTFTFGLINSIFNSEDKLVQVYPNPNNGNFKITFENHGMKKVLLGDLSGKVIEERYIDEINSDWQLSNLPKGMYLLNIIDVTSEKKKVVKLYIK